MHRLSLSALVGGLALTLTLSSCGPSKQEFGSLEPGNSPDGEFRSGLEVPPDLVETSSDTIVSNRAQETNRTQEVLPEIENLDIQRNDEEGWIQVNADADDVWRKLEAHWASLGIQLVEANPTTGTMETDWVLPADQTERNDFGIFEGVLKNFLGRTFDQATALDKYTIQLERKKGGRTRVIVAHRGMKRIQTQRATRQYNEEYAWVETDEEPKKIKRVLTSIAYGLKSTNSS